MGRAVDGLCARVVDDEDDEVPRWHAGRADAARRRALAFATGYFGMPEKTVEAWRNLLVPYRRPRRPRARRLLLLHRPPEGRDPPARREHLLVRGRAGAAQPSRGRRGRRLPVRSELAEDEVMAADRLREPGSPLDEVAMIRIARRAWRISWCRASSSSSTICRRPRTARSQKYKLRERGITDRRPGTARLPASPSNGDRDHLIGRPCPACAGRASYGYD